MIIRLDSATTPEIELLGGKSLGLLRLIGAGLRVPEAWTIPATVSVDPHAQAALLADDLPTWWAQASAAHPGSAWAVRSSAVAEDMEGASFAGIYETVLGLTDLDAIQDAVRRCWSALDADRARTYREATGNEAPGIALILQRMLEPEVAGVLLTVNPMHPFEDEMSVDASWGLGEAVVSGRTDPDNYVIEPDSGAVRRHRIGAKELEVVRIDGTVVDRKVSPQRREIRCLDDVQLAQLAEVGRRAAESFGGGRDLEWAFAEGRLYALQDRPITGLPPRRPKVVCARAIGDEYLSGCGRPLQLDISGPWMSETMFGDMGRFLGVKGAEGALDYHRGYLFINGGFVAEMLSALPRTARDNMLSQWFSPIWRETIETRRWRPLGAIRALAAPVFDVRRSLLVTTNRALDAHARRVTREVMPLLTADLTGWTAAEWERGLDLGIASCVDHFRVIRWGMMLHNPVLHSLLERLLQTWLGDDGTLYSALISEIPTTWTARTNDDLQVLAARARDAGLGDRLGDGESYDALRSSTPGSPFWEAFDQFVLRHGHRAESRDYADPRWREEPDTVLGLVASALRVAPGRREEIARRNEARVAAAETAISAEAIGRARALTLRHVLAWTREYTAFRENQRYFLDYQLTWIRMVVCEAARRLVDRGILAHEDDVFLLQLDELRSLVRGEGAADTLDAELDSRRAEWLVSKDRLPAAYLFDGVETDGEVALAVREATDDPAVQTGVAIARGVGRGPVRVVRTLADLARVQPGDVMVAQTVDPAWTGVFPLLAGLVTEIGGTLSHGAILAREYGLPSVAGIRGAVATLAEGEAVEVDGGAGTVRRLAPTG